MERVVWVRPLPGKRPDDLRSVLWAAVGAGFDRIVVEDPDEVPRDFGRFSPILLKGDVFVSDGIDMGRRVTIRSAKDASSVRGMRGKTRHLVIETEDWKIIPLENLIAHFQGSQPRLGGRARESAAAKP